MHSLEITRDILQQTLPPALGMFASAYLSAGLAQLETLPVTAPTFIDDRQPLAPLARQYMDALLAGQRHTASELVTAAVQRGVSVKDVYLDIFQATQYEIGRLWQTNQVNVAQEHYCTAATQLIMSQLYPLIFATEKNGHRLVAACVGRELHEIWRPYRDRFFRDGRVGHLLSGRRTCRLQALCKRSSTEKRMSWPSRRR